MKVTPHFWNLNEDPALTGMVVHFTKSGKRNISHHQESLEIETYRYSTKKIIHIMNVYECNGANMFMS